MFLKKKNNVTLSKNQIVPVSNHSKEFWQWGNTFPNKPGLFFE